MASEAIKTPTVRNSSRNVLLAEHVETPQSHAGRMKGLIGRQSLKPGEAMLFSGWGCGWITTFFMRFPIDVLFINGDKRIIAINESMPPFRLSRLYLTAAFVVELPGGTVRSTGTCIGDTLELPCLQA